jgi:hypothetical protein
MFNYVIKFTMMSLPPVQQIGYQTSLTPPGLQQGEAPVMIWFHEKKIANNIYISILSPTTKAVPFWREVLLVTASCKELQSFTNHHGATT